MEAAKSLRLYGFCERRARGHDKLVFPLYNPTGPDDDETFSLIMPLQASPQVYQRLGRLSLVILLLTLALGTRAQGGPPMVTDDPDTPGDGKWEVNVGAIGARSQGQWLLAAPDLDMNYGWGDRLQLKLDAPLDLGNASGRWQYGVGTTLAGVKWRYYEESAEGWHLSTYPQLAFNPVSGSVARGLASPGESFFLPLEASRRFGTMALVAEAGRYFTQFASAHPAGSNQWIGGVLMAQQLGEADEIMVEARHTRANASDGSGTGTLYNLGARHECSEHLSLMGAMGRQAQSADPGRTSLLVYLGVQVRY